MRRLILSTVTAVTLVGGALTGTHANAMPATSGLNASATRLPIAQVRLVCERVWNGYRWVRSCYETGPRYYDGGAGYGFGYGAPSFYLGGGFGHHHHHHHHGHHHHGGHHGGGHHGGGHHGGGHHHHH